MAADQSEIEYRAAVGRRFQAVREALGYDNRSKLAKLYASDPNDKAEVKAWADRIRKWEEGEALVPAYRLRPLKTKHHVTYEWIFDADPIGLPYPLGDKLLQLTG